VLHDGCLAPRGRDGYFVTSTGQWAGFAEIAREGNTVTFVRVSNVKDGVERYETGATRSADKLFDPEGFISPRFLELFSEYMEKHRIQKDGQIRDSDNWQKGFDLNRVKRSLIRHMLDAWLMLRGYPPHSKDCTSLFDALCAIVFNCMVLATQGQDIKV
jgi:hypothetical protein